MPSPSGEIHSEDTVPLISVIICTHNRADFLPRALESVLIQDVDPALYEIVIVDNNIVPDPSTRAIAERYTARHVRYINEPKIGLSVARNRGIQEAHADYIGFIDDDVEVEAGWLHTAVEIIQNHRPAAFGGRALPLYIPDAPKPDWYLDRYLIQGYWGDTARSLKVNEYIFGMNMFWRRDTLDALGQFDPEYGMVGKRIGYAEETILQVHLRALMPAEVIYYHPALTVKHIIRAEKFQWQWILRQRFARGQYSFRIRYERKGRKPRSVITRAIIILKSVVRALLLIGRMIMTISIGTFRRDRKRYPHPVTFIYERGLRPIRGIGALYEKTRLMLRDSTPVTLKTTPVRTDKAPTPE